MPDIDEELAKLDHCVLADLAADFYDMVGSLAFEDPGDMDAIDGEGVADAIRQFQALGLPLSSEMEKFLECWLEDED